MSSVRFDPPQHPAHGPRHPGPPVAETGPDLGAWDEVAPPGSMSDDRDRGEWRTLSVIVPARDEAASLPRLMEEITGALRPLCRARVGDCADSGGACPTLSGFEVIVVDDGSTDETASVLRRLAAAYPELRTLRLLEGAGQSAAVALGFRAARGHWLATLDADLQNDPADLVTLWKALPGHDAALGWRVRRADSWSRRVVSRWANRVRNAVLGQSIRDTGCSVRIFPRGLALRLPLFHGVHRFFGPLLIREGCRIVQVPVNHRPRPHGRSHYTLRNRSIRVLVDLLGVSWLMGRPLPFQVAGETGERTGPALHPVQAASPLVRGGGPEPWR